MQPERLLAGHRQPEELPAFAVLDPILVLMGDDDQHRLAGAYASPVTFVLEPARAGQRMLDDRERRLAALAPVPAVGGVGGDLIAGAGRHDVQPVSAASERDGRAAGSARAHRLQHRITRHSTSVLFSRGAGLPYLS